MKLKKLLKTLPPGYSIVHSSVGGGWYVQNAARHHMTVYCDTPKQALKKAPETFDQYDDWKQHNKQ